jgi:hypothetical protein
LRLRLLLLPRGYGGERAQNPAESRGRAEWPQTHVQEDPKMELFALALAWLFGGAIALAALAFVTGFVAYWLWAVAHAGWLVAELAWRRRG